MSRNDRQIEREKDTLFCVCEREDTIRNMKGKNFELHYENANYLLLHMQNAWEIQLE